jgi:hypothetical protein
MEQNLFLSSLNLSHVYHNLPDQTAGDDGIVAVLEFFEDLN